MIKLDTHILIFAFNGTVTSREQSVLRVNDWGISAIVLWEIAKLAQLGRISLDISDPSLSAALSDIHVWPIDVAIAQASTRLDFRGDPADDLIAATSIVHRVPLLTRDKQIRSSSLLQLA